MAVMNEGEDVFITSPPVFASDAKLTISFGRNTILFAAPFARSGTSFPVVYTFRIPASFRSRLANCAQCSWLTFNWYIEALGQNVATGTITGGGRLPSSVLDCSFCPGAGEADEDGSEAPPDSSGGSSRRKAFSDPGNGGPSNVLPPDPTPPAQNPCVPPPSAFPQTPPVPTPCS